MAFVACVRNGELSKPYPPVCEKIMCMVFDQKSKETAIVKRIPEENILEVEDEDSSYIHSLLSSSS